MRLLNTLKIFIVRNFGLKRMFLRDFLFFLILKIKILRWFCRCRT